MAKSAQGKLEEAKYLDKEARALAKTDPVSSSELKALARGKRKAAIKQMRTRPKRHRSRVAW